MADTTTPRILALMGSGETAPTMVTTHRRLAGRLVDGPAAVRAGVRAVVLDTPYGFQENAPELAERAVAYFSESIDVDLAVAGLTRMRDADPLVIEQGLAAIRSSDYVFAGPGSPTYAVDQWRGTVVPELLTTKLDTGGIVVFASAAALTMGSHTVPVYEIYKCGMEPHWVDGLGILGHIGINAVVIPHFDNAEGGHHDTRFCYLGERRLVQMEALLPTDTWVLGVDEHTGLVIDLDAGRADVVGNGTVTVRVDGASQVHPSGSTIALEHLVDPSATATTTAASTPTTATPASEPTSTPPAATSLSTDIAEAAAEFDAAIEASDADGAVRAVLRAEAAIHAWSADTLQGDDADRARSTLRAMITRLGAAARDGLVDPRTIRGPLIDILLDIRAGARADKQYELSDLVRDRLAAAGITVNDTAEGAVWEIAD
ncbi:MAG: hypothetical protein ACO20G_07505 [Ilumatobacteraceae bacterium]